MNPLPKHLNRRRSCDAHRFIPRRAFTLIELLVVVSIIATLIGILLPVLARARQVGRRTTCAVRLREVGNAAFYYLQSDKFFPSLNNEPSDGHWQYNYIIWDGRDLDHNFGPFVLKNLIPDMQVLFCPVQSSPHHQFKTYVNPWPIQELLDTRAGFGRRPMITGLDVTQLPASTALYADLLHAPDYVSEKGHKNGVNVVYADGHARFVQAFERLIDNEMTLPTSLIDNPTMMQIWKKLDARE
ncbi:MAG: type II secretion system protein [Planctomycetia bacterium]|jgi:prepilin-type N-terminal cleavage/methylation domain-containing protein/prepilin-type processing-associated H-X9-DG protein|nr:type II secretion system protein [Planctomycetia bacterium]MCC7316236.1 type II secretion system protein [Planctomycetota bacterium]OQY98472.1 MAG: hypothetical protein B6D36_17525 [Planctomycetes bacterium UTPLA1]